MIDAKKRILVAEDNRVLADVLQFNLTRAGFDVTIAVDGRDAIGLLEVGPFDLLITDYQMPDVDGAELCRYVRRSPHLSDLHIIMCSAKSLELSFEQLHEDWKIAKLIYKPFSVREILSVVRSLLTPTPVTNPICS